VSLEGKNLTLNGNTNIPDGSVLTISTNRYVEYTELEGKRVVALDDGETTVKNGAFTYSAYLTDKEWYEEDLEENKLLGIDFRKIYEDCYVLVTFTPKAEQPKEVYEALGNNFERLNIEGESGSFKSIQVKKGFELPLEEGL